MSKLSKISLNGTVYDIGGENEDIIHHTWTTESGTATEGDDLSLGQAILDKLIAGKNVLLDIHTNDTPSYIANYYHTNFDGLYSYDTSQNTNGHYTSIRYKSNEETPVYNGSASNGATITNRYMTLQITVANDVVTRVKLGYVNNQMSLLPTNNIKAYEPTSDYHPATKKYVDDNTSSALQYYDSGYYITPTKWTVVSSLPEYTREDTLYFVCPDYVEKNQMVSVSSNGFNEGVTWSHITTNLIKPSDGSIVESWQATATDRNNNTSTVIRAPKYSVKLGATPNYTNTIGDDLNMYGVYEARNPDTTALLYSAYLDVDSGLTSGTMYYFDRDDYEETDIEVNMTGYTSIYYTIGTNGGLACLKGDTPILTKGNKKKNIEDIKEGDIVIDAEGKETKVIKTLSHNIDMTFNIELSNSDVLTASYGHKFSIRNHFRRTCQVVKDHELDRQDGSTFKVTNVERKQENITVYEILTESKTYALGNGVICECEDI